MERSVDVRRGCGWHACRDGGRARRWQAHTAHSRYTSASPPAPGTPRSLRPGCRAVIAAATRSVRRAVRAACCAAEPASRSHESTGHEEHSGRRMTVQGRRRHRGWTEGGSERCTTWARGPWSMPMMMPPLCRVVLHRLCTQPASPAPFDCGLSSAFAALGCESASAPNCPPSPLPTRPFSRHPVHVQLHTHPLPILSTHERTR